MPINKALKYCKQHGVEAEIQGDRLAIIGTKNNKAWLKMRRGLVSPCDLMDVVAIIKAGM